MNYAKENYKHKDEIATPVALKIPCHMGKQVFDNGHIVKSILYPLDFQWQTALEPSSKNKVLMETFGLKFKFPLN